MRHGCRVAKLGLPADQRKALLRNLTTELLRHGEITITLTRAKALRKEVERIITLAKNGSLESRRAAMAYLYDVRVNKEENEEKEAKKVKLVNKLFAEAPERFGDRSSGYTKITRTKNRRGDNAPMAIIELI